MRMIYTGDTVVKFSKKNSTMYSKSSSQDWIEIIFAHFLFPQCRSWVGVPHLLFRPPRWTAPTRSWACCPLLLTRGGARKLVWWAEGWACKRGGERFVRGRWAAGGSVLHTEGLNLGRLRLHHRRGRVLARRTQQMRSDSWNGFNWILHQCADHSGEAGQWAGGTWWAVEHTQAPARSLPPAATVWEGRSGAEQPVWSVGRRPADRGLAQGAGRGWEGDAGAGRAAQSHPVCHVQCGAAWPGLAASFREERDQPDGGQPIQRRDEGASPAGVPAGQCANMWLSCLISARLQSGK